MDFRKASEHNARIAVGADCNSNCERSILMPNGKGSSEERKEFEVVEATMDHLKSVDSEAATLAPGSQQKPISRDLLGQAFGDYQILREIARGGMGIVYQAKQISLNRIVALKMILSGKLASGDDVKRFYLEAESAASLDHPAIVPIYEIGSCNGQHFFSMGYVDGPSLANVLKDGPLPPKMAAEYLARVCDAIQYAHDRGLIHRDLKPANILLATEKFSLGQDSEKGHSNSTIKGAVTNSRAERFDAKAQGSSLPSSNPRENRSSHFGFGLVPKVTDFGLAKQIDGNSDLTGTGQVLGTPSYMPPEQADGRVANVGPLSDVYSLGAILYCMLTGRPPFQSANPIDTIIQVIKEPPIAPRQLNPSVPRDLETICLKAIEKSPSKRFASASEMQAELNRYLAGEPIVARPISGVERGSRWLWRHPTVALMGVVVLAAIGSVVGTIYTSNRRLQYERDFAIQATEEAKTQRALAEKRLDKAIEAVDQMMVRTASERWATRPELQEERQRVLEDAVTFYESFGEENKQDSRVQFEAAKAQSRVSEAYLLLNSLDSSLKAAKKSDAIYKRLIAEFPQVPGYRSSCSEVASAMGDINALSGNYTEAAANYTAAIELASAACDLEANNREFQIRLVEAQSHQAYFLLAIEPEVGRSALKGLMLLARKLGEKDMGGYVERLAFGFSLTVEGAYSLSNSDFEVASKCYEEAWQLLEVLKGQPPPNTRHAAQYKYTRAIVAVQRGIVGGLRGKTDEEKELGLARIREGIELFDQLLLVNPKAFPYRLQKIQSIRSRANLHRYFKEETNAKEDEKNAMDLLAEVSRDNPNLEWVSGFNSMQQSVQWVGEIKAGKLDEFELTADRLLKNSKPSVRADVKYNVACAYALASTKVIEMQDAYATRAVELLNELMTKDYFKQKQRLENLMRDNDLDPIRERDDFRAFLKALVGE